MAHAKYAPSSAKRVITCPPSLLLCAAEPDRESYPASEGTVAHHVSEECLRDGKTPDEFFGDTINSKWVSGDYDEDEPVGPGGFEIEVDEEMVVGVMDYIEWVSSLPGDHFIESRVNISRWCPIEDQFGTCDHAAAMPRKLVVTDLKYGKGVKVFADKNYQLVLYALGFIDEWDWLYDFDEVQIRISQPRLDHKDVWHTTKAELLEIGAYILERFTLAEHGFGEFGPSQEGCRFCKVNYKCRPLTKHLFDTNVMAFDVIEGEFENDITFLTEEELSWHWLMKSVYENRIKAIERHLHTRMSDSMEVAGLKLVEGKKTRYWKDEQEAVDFLMDFGVDPKKLRTEPKLVSPAMAEKLVPAKTRKELAAFISAKPGNPCLVSINDKRRDYTASALDAFDDLDADSDNP